MQKTFKTKEGEAHQGKGNSQHLRQSVAPSKPLLNKFKMEDGEVSEAGNRVSLTVWHFSYSTQVNGAFNTIILQPLEKFTLL
jgi:hypothetical protein